MPYLSLALLAAATGLGGAVAATEDREDPEWFLRPGAWVNPKDVEAYLASRPQAPAQAETKAPEVADDAG